MQLPEPGVGTDWDTTGISFLKGVHLLVHLDPPPAHHHPHMAGTEIAAAKGIGAGEAALFVFCIIGSVYFFSK